MSNVENTNKGEGRYIYPGILPGSVKGNLPDIPAALQNKGLSRRRLLQAMGALGTAAVVPAVPGVVSRPATLTAKTAPARPAVLNGDLTDIKHVVIFMQENRSFDHYYGTLRGVRGFSDKQALQFPDGTNVFQQPDEGRADGVMLPFRMETGVYNAQNAGGLNNGWTAEHIAMNMGAENGWIVGQGEQTMGYFTADDIPWQYALASQYTICDHYYEAACTSTSPNRDYMWTGTIDPAGLNGGPALDNSQYNYGYTWQTYPEVLQAAGVSWQVYVNNNADTTGWLGDFTDNLLRAFAPYNPANANATNTVPGQGLLARANVLETNTPTTVPDTSDDLDYVLEQFINDCAAGTIPQVSWIVSPYLWSEHPNAAPDWGAVYTNRVIAALQSNDDLWNSTLLILTFDESDGYFDHVPAPIAEPGTDGEYVTSSNTQGYNVDGWTVGPGPRVPTILISPWTRGGYIASEVFDHTSLLQFLEQWTTALGTPALCTNISAWRRSVSGDLTSALDMKSYDNSYPVLPDSSVLAAAALNDANLPSVLEAIPGPYLQSMPVQDTGDFGVRPVPYQQHGTLTVDRATGKVTANLTNRGSKAVSMLTYPDNYLTFAATPNTVARDTPKTYTWDTTQTDGNYAFSTYGPDRFLRSFAGTVVPAHQNIGAVPVVDAELVAGSRPALRITLRNEGLKPVQYTLTVNDFDGSGPADGNQTLFVTQGQPATIVWPTDDNGYYDVIITTDTDDNFTHRYAGRISKHIS